MKLQTILTTLLLSLLLIFSACNSSSKCEEKNTTVIAQSQQSVKLSSVKADSYSWTQVSGASVIMIDS